MLTFSVTAWWFSDRQHLPISLQESFQAQPEPMRWKLEFEPDGPSDAIAAKDPETLVRQIYKHLGEGERAQALATARSLSKQFPSFQLGQLLYADLLNISSQQPVQGADLEAEGQSSALRRLEELLLEAKRRMTRPSPKPCKDRYPHR